MTPHVDHPLATSIAAGTAVISTSPPVRSIFEEVFLGLLLSDWVGIISVLAVLLSLAINIKRLFKK